MKGFVFTLLTLLVISYMLLEFNIYYKVYEIRKEIEPTRLRSLVLNEIAMLLRDENIDRIAQISAYQAIYELSNKACKNKTTFNVSKGVKDLMERGSYSENGINLNIDVFFKDYSNKVSELAKKSGFNLTTDFSVEEVYQGSPFSINVNYSYSIYLRDDVERTKITRTSVRSISIPVIGFVDPLLCRRMGITRNVLQSPWDLNDIKPKILFNGTKSVYGKGFLYGEVFGGQCYGKDAFNELIKNNPGYVFNESNKERILCTSSADIAQSYHPLFGAVIVFDPDINEESTFLNRVSDIDIFLGNYGTGVPSEIPTKGSILIYSEYDSNYTKNQKHYVYDMEKLYKFAVCGYYISNGAVQNEKGFSFIRRIESDTGINDSNNIETFLIGNWAPNSFNTTYNCSSVDYLYLSFTKGNKTIGMPGCKFLEMCNLSSISAEQRVRFRIDANHSKAYGIENLICGDRCGGN